MCVCVRVCVCVSRMWARHQMMCVGTGVGKRESKCVGVCVCVCHVCVCNTSQAVSLHPGHFGYHLNLGHAWELEQRLDKVIDVAARGMRLAIQQGVTLGGGTDLQVRLCLHA